MTVSLTGGPLHGRSVTMRVHPELGIVLMVSGHRYVITRVGPHIVAMFEEEL